MAAKLIKRRGPRALAHGRSETLYTYVTPSSKKFVKALSKEYGISESMVNDALVQWAAYSGPTFTRWFKGKFGDDFTYTQKVINKGARNTRTINKYA